MKFWQSFIRIYLLLNFASCATDNAAKVRQERPYTIGFTGVGYRPNADVGINAHLNLKDNFTAGSSSSFEEERDRNVKNTGTNVSGSIVYFPWTTSAFNVGIGVSKGDGKWSFDADGAASTDKNSRVNVKYRRVHTAIGVPLGWYWIWENGITLSLDIGPRMNTSKSLSWVDDGGTNVNSKERDDFQSKIEGTNKVTYGGAGVFGYSF